MKILDPQVEAVKVQRTIWKLNAYYWAEPDVAVSRYEIRFRAILDEEVNTLIADVAIYIQKEMLKLEKGTNTAGLNDV